MKIYFYSLILIFFHVTPFGDEKKDLLLPELVSRVLAAVSCSEERAIGKEFLKQIYFQAPLISDPLIQEYT